MLRAFKAQEIQNLREQIKSASEARDAALARLELAKDANKIADEKMQEFDVRLSALTAEVKAHGSSADLRKELSDLAGRSLEILRANNAVSSALLPPPPHTNIISVGGEDIEPKWSGTVLTVGPKKK